MVAPAEQRYPGSPRRAAYGGAVDVLAGYHDAQPDTALERIDQGLLGQPEVRIEPVHRVLCAARPGRCHTDATREPGAPIDDQQLAVGSVVQAPKV